MQGLKGILGTGFRFSDCVEELPSNGFSANVDHYLSTLKCVCFCDIPLSQSEEHRSQYGDYSIAMSKQWAVDVGVTPIRYLHHNSPDVKAFFFRRLGEIREGFSKCSGGLVEFYVRYLKEVGCDYAADIEKDLATGSEGVRELLKLIEDDYLEVMDCYSRLIALSRIYEGKWDDRRSGQAIRRTFYDEREWRAIALAEEQNNLKFSFKDINYIIVNNMNEKEELIDYMQGEDISQALDITVASRGKISDKVFMAEALYADA